MTPQFAAGHIDGCLDTPPRSMDDDYVNGYFAGHAVADTYR